MEDQLIQKYQDKHDLLLEEYNKISSNFSISYRDQAQILPVLRSHMKDILEIIDDLKKI